MTRILSIFALPLLIVYCASSTGGEVSDVWIDLEPVRPLCEKTNEGLLVKVRNNGNNPVAARVLVTFSYASGDVRTATTSPIPQGEVRQTVVSMPSPPGGDYDIAIDVEPADEDLSDRNPENNLESEHCIG